MFRLFIDPGWLLYAYAVDSLIAVPRVGSISWALYPWWDQCFPCSRVFSVSYPGRVLTFLLSLGGPVYGSVHHCSYFIVFSFVCFPVSTLFFYVIDIFSSGFGSSLSSDDCQVNQLKQKLKLTVFALRASGTSENYLTAFNRWAESLVFLSVLWTVPSTCSLFYSLQSRRLPLTAHFTLSSGCIRLQEWILLPYTPPLSLRRTELFALFSQPASHRNVPLEVTHLKQLAERTLTIVCNLEA